ncbi:MAG: 50S ribosomal protein L11 methyltransferase [Gemmatimonadota bacterium]
MSYVELTVAAPVAAEETVTAALAACDTLGGWVEKPGLFRGYFSAPAADLTERFRGAWRDLAGEPCSHPIVVREVATRDWLGDWRAAARSIAITPRLWIAPPGAGPEHATDSKVVWIQPGLGFGTGSHPTTQALLRWLDRESPFRSVLDVGTGSGVLALAAVVLGAGRVVGLDIDPDAITGAIGNRARNVQAGELMLVRGSTASLSPDSRFDCVLANLDGPTLSDELPRIADLCSPGGRVGVAGLLLAEHERLTDASQQLGLELLDQRHDPDPTFGEVWWAGWFAAPDGRA